MALELLRQVTGLSEPTLSAMAGGAFQCVCGRRHSIPLQAVRTEPGCAAEAGPFLRDQGASTAWLLADEATFEAAGRLVEQSCRDAGVRVRLSVLPAAPPPHADREALGRLAFDLQPDRAPLIAVGSGTIFDLARFLAYRTGSDFAGVPTAPSVDGFTSSVAAMLVDGVRITYPALPPLAVFADPDVVATAPPELVASGYAEMAGKLTALADWRLSEVLNGEYHCPLAEEMVAESSLPLLQGPVSPGQLMEGHLWVGLAMLMMGNSRPASGAEHHLAHYWEMRALWEGREPHLHGVRVGVATAIVQRVYEELFDRRLGEAPAALTSERPTGHSGGRAHAGDAEIREWFGPVAERMLTERRSWPATTKPYGPRPLAPEALRAAAEAIRPHRVAPEQVRRVLQGGGAPARPAEIGVDPGLLRTSLLAAKEIRPRYTVLHLANELGLLETIAEAVAATGP